VHHDALELANGRIVLVTKLKEGQCATVLQLPSNRQFGKAQESSSSRRPAAGAPVEV
jgi:hypothetical protein